MRKGLKILLCGLLAMCLCACGSSKSSDTTDANDVEDTTEVEEIEKEAQEEAQEEVKKAEKEAEEQTKTEEKTTTKTKTESTNGIRTEIKEAIDSYEDFMDEYIAFMKTYDSSDLTMLNQYTKFMTQYAETTEKFKALENKNLTDEENLYYLKVMNRVNEKLLEANISAQ
jgi:hypothetical protein